VEEIPVVLSLTGGADRLLAEAPQLHREAVALVEDRAVHHLGCISAERTVLAACGSRRVDQPFERPDAERPAEDQRPGETELGKGDLEHGSDVS